jgi:hypothetical protein
MAALARIGGPDVVACLTGLRLESSWQQQYVHQALARIGTPEALDHLAALGAYHQLAAVGDPRAADIAGAHLRQGDLAEVLSAARLLRVLPDPRWAPDLVEAYDRLEGAGVRVEILAALHACGASAEVRKRVPDLMDGPYAYLAQALLERLTDQDDSRKPPAL